jgi:hypothetical protein
MSSCLGIDVGLRNLSLCVLQKNNDQYSILDWRLVDVRQLCGLKQVSCKKLTSAQIHNIAHFVLPRIFPKDYMKKHAIAHVSIEQQPMGRMTNQRMVLFSQLLFHYFRTFIWNVEWGDYIQTVRLTSAGQKYQKSWMTTYGLQTSKKYKIRKENSIILCERLCSDLHVQGDKSIFDDDTKKDDLADAFLLALVIWLKWS